MEENYMPKGFRRKWKNYLLYTLGGKQTKQFLLITWYNHSILANTQNYVYILLYTAESFRNCHCPKLKKTVISYTYFWHNFILTGFDLVKIVLITQQLSRKLSVYKTESRYGQG